MAVVQISRIQLRRGRVGNSNPPTLASGEMGWAIDTQELFIGNGAVSEGAPEVGNTKILTERDNLFDLINNFSLGKDGDNYNITTGVSPSQPINRTLQAKLDDYVSVRDFGATGDGTDQTAALQRALYELFLEQSPGFSNVTLRIPAGTYLTSAPLYVPPGAKIIGDGKGNTVIQQINGIDDSVFAMVNSSWDRNTNTEDSTTVDNQSKNVIIKDLSIDNTTNFGGCIRLSSTIDSVFENLSLTTAHDFATDDLFTDAPTDLLIVDKGGIKFLYSGANAYPSDNNKFKNIDFVNMVYGVDAPKNANYNIFENCNFQDVGFGLMFGEIDGVSSRVIPTSDFIYAPAYNTVSNCNFNDVRREAWKISKGDNNRSVNNTFLRVGNNGGSSAGNAWPILNFDGTGNVSEYDFFQRTQDLALDFNNFNSSESDLLIDNFADFNYYPEVAGNFDYENRFPIQKSIGPSDAPLPGDSSLETTFMYVPAPEVHGVIEIDYKYNVQLTSSQLIRDGKLRIIYDRRGSEVRLSDDYTFVGDNSRDELLTFSAVYADGRDDIISIKVINETMLDGEPHTDLFTATMSHKSTLLIGP